MTHKIKRLDESQGTTLFDLDVARGSYPILSTQRKFGVIPSISSGDPPTDVWEFGVSQNEYIYPEWGTAPIDTLSSSDAADTVPITVIGLDINGLEVTQEVTLLGQAKATLATPLWRVYRMYNSSENLITGQGVELVGTVYCYEDTAIVLGVPTDDNKVRAQILPSNNQTQMMIYTIPADAVGYMLRGETGIQKGGNQVGSVTVQFRVREFGGVFRVSKTVGLISEGNSYFSTERHPFQTIPPLTDIKATVTDMTGNNPIGMFAEISMIIEKSDEQYIPS
jgi:hypothetical protein